MADKLVTLQDENQQPIYPETRAAAVKTADGRILEEGTPSDIFDHPLDSRLQDFLSKVL